ncbi:hypothetical protein GGR34_003682 [Microvirga flocculans]|uniref:Uncharacterized protein n=1 Tax=Microvirga flocculans TaxID=217168 RepID=A0A7W6IIC8_9HYPH|nr:hypothetical protein [Microvirga flocculans]MBB4041997.1 hypothetical protein [Microvirga flocculans]
MAAKARIEWIRLGYGPEMDGVAENVIRSIHGAVEIDISTTATAAGQRPVVPEFGTHSRGYALVRGLEGTFVVAWGTDPTAQRLNGKLIKSGEEVPILLKSGELLSFIEVV